MTHHVCLAIIDDSFAFLNDALTHAGSSDDPKARSSRFNALWLQTRERAGGDGLETGPRLTQSDIGQALRDRGDRIDQIAYAQPLRLGPEGPIRAIDWTQAEHQPLAFDVSHGTFVAATALESFDRANSGAPLSLYGITVPTEVTEDTSGASLGPYVIAALRQAMIWSDAADDGAPAPLVINLSYGFTAGAKDGSDRLTRSIATLLEARNALGRPTALVVPMGNGLDARGTAAFALAPGASLTLTVDVYPDDFTPSFLEVFARRRWGDAVAEFDLTIQPPREALPALTLASQDADLSVSHHLPGPSAPLASWSFWPPHSESRWSRRGFLAIAPTASFDAPDDVAPDGGWQIAFRNTSDAEIEMRCCIQRDDAPGTYPFRGQQATLSHPSALQFSTPHDGPMSLDWTQLNPNGPLRYEETANVLASTASPYVLSVAAGMGAHGDAADQDWVQPSPYSAAEPLLEDRERPYATVLSDRSAVFRGIFGPGTASGVEVTQSGTSVAAPQIAGRLAADLGRDPTALDRFNLAQPAALDRGGKGSKQHRTDRLTTLRTAPRP